MINPRPTPTPAHLPSWRPPPPRRPPGLIALLAALVVLCGAALVTLVVLSAEDKTTPESSASEEPRINLDTPDAPPTPTPSPAPLDAPETVTINIESTPSGAEVYRDSVLIGTTPLVLELPRGETRETWQVLADDHAIGELDVGLDMSGAYELALQPATAERAAEPSAGERGDDDPGEPEPRGRTTIQNVDSSLIPD